MASSTQGANNGEVAALVGQESERWRIRHAAA